MSFSVIVKDGKDDRTYTVKSFDELTLGDWRTLTTPPIEPPTTVEGQLEVSHQLLKRHTGIPLKSLRRLPPKEADKLIDAIGETLKLAMQVGMKEDPKYVPERRLVMDGRFFTVPLDLESETTYGQWADLHTAGNMDSEADIMLRYMAVLITEEDVPYDGGQVAEREQLFAGMNMVEAQRMASFFFSRSERFRNAVNLSSHSLLTWIKRAATTMLTPLGNTTAGT